MESRRSNRDWTCALLQSFETLPSSKMQRVPYGICRRVETRGGEGRERRVGNVETRNAEKSAGRRHIMASITGT